MLLQSKNPINISLQYKIVNNTKEKSTPLTKAAVITSLYAHPRFHYPRKKTLSTTIHHLKGTLYSFNFCILHLRRTAWCQDWHRLWSPGKQGCGAGSVGIWWKRRKTTAVNSSETSIDTLLSELTYCTHSTARPFCMYSVMHLINWSFSSSNCERNKRHIALNPETDVSYLGSMQ